MWQVPTFSRMKVLLWKKKKKKQHFFSTQVFPSFSNEGLSVTGFNMGSHWCPSTFPCCCLCLAHCGTSWPVRKGRALLPGTCFQEQHLHQALKTAGLRVWSYNFSYKSGNSISGTAHCNCSALSTAGLQCFYSSSVAASWGRKLLLHVLGQLKWRQHKLLCNDRARKPGLYPVCDAQAYIANAFLWFPVWF